MKQHITITAEAPNTGHNIEILSAYQVGEEIYVLIEHSSRGGGGEVICKHEKEIDVETSADHELPVKKYIFNNKHCRMFNVYGDFGVWAIKPDVFQLLNSEHDFKKLTAGGTRLYAVPKDKIDLQTLLDDKTVAADVPRKVLQDAGIDSDVAYQLLQQNPHCVEIMQVMQAGGVFGDDAVENNNLFAELVEGMTLLGSKHKDDLIQIYHLMAGKIGMPCLLTPATHDIILDDVLHRIRWNNLGIMRMLQLLQHLQISTQKTADLVFACLADCQDIHYLTRGFDQTNASELYLYEHAASGQVVAEFANYMTFNMDRHDHAVKPYPWLTTEYFKYIVDHIDDFRNLVDGFDTLDKLNMLVSHGEKFKQNTDANIIFSALKRYDGELLPVDVEAAMENTEFAPVLKLFDSLELTGQCGSDKDKPHIFNMYRTILHHPELTRAVGVLQEIYEANRKKLFAEHRGGLDHQTFKAFKQLYEDEIQALISASLLEVNQPAKRHGCGEFFMGLFTAPRPLTLAERTEKLYEKYDYYPEKMQLGMK